ncbi:hypothetical protein BKA62DRAFT_709940 [Auriculariales sp. MPI-PUGE-AT-0066]|nr:hypothetical protein BKA62DRAFT_709940 [Auriculariales sp. MPI-PUGE-AT-0066]
MPHINVKNNTQRNLHVGLFILGILHPTRHHILCRRLPSFVPQSIEVRAETMPTGDDYDIGHSYGKTFHHGETLDGLGKMAAAGAAGTGAVLLGMAGVLAPMPPQGRAAAMAGASMAMNAACGLGNAAGVEQFGHEKRASLWVGWGEMNLSVRESGSTIEIWHGDNRL